MTRVLRVCLCRSEMSRFASGMTATGLILYHFDPMFASRVTGVLEHWGSRVPRGSELPVVEGHGRQKGA